jgi:putative SOS response-associated peptidase YedK
MCSEYKINAAEADLALLMGDQLENDGDEAWIRHVKLFGKAPVLYEIDGQLKLEEMRFSYLPPGGRIPFSANTRLDDWDERRGLTFAYQRPTWREGFLKRRCVIPLTEFLEPIYSGEYAGEMMSFNGKTDKILLVAGIYNETVDEKTGELTYGFSMLTDFAGPTVGKVGHHRGLIFLNPQAARQWIEDREIKGPDGIRFLLANKIQPELDFKSERTMKNWKARVAGAVQKAEDEDRIRPIVEKARQKELGQG